MTTLQTGEALTLDAAKITRTVLALYAGASGDHNPVHIAPQRIPVSAHSTDNGRAAVFFHPLLRWDLKLGFALFANRPAPRADVIGHQLRRRQRSGRATMRSGSALRTFAGRD